MKKESQWMTTKDRGPHSLELHYIFNKVPNMLRGKYHNITPHSHHHTDPHRKILP